MIEQLVWRAPSNSKHNRATKIIAQPRYVDIPQCRSVHAMQYLPGYYAIDPDLLSPAQPEKLQAPQNASPQPLRINHYWSRAADWAFGEGG